jgi:hypothetical protein
VKVTITLDGVFEPDSLVPAEVEIDRVPLEMSPEEYNALVNVLEHVKLRIREFVI